MIQEGSENGNMDDLFDIKMRKMGTGYEQSINDVYGGIGVVRNNNYFNEAPVSSGSKFVGSRLRRLQSYQVWMWGLFNYFLRQYCYFYVFFISWTFLLIEA